MLINRKAMVDHLGKVYCNGQVKEAVFTEGFECAALNADHQLVVLAPGLKGVEPLPEPVGVIDVSLFKRALSSLAGDSDEVAIDFEDNRIKLEQKHGGRIRLLTATVNLISSAMKPATVQKIREMFPVAPPPKKGKKAAPVVDGAVPLSETVIKGYLEQAGLIGPETVTLRVGKTGSVLVIGQESGHMGELDIPAKLDDGEKSYELIFSAKLMTDVFKQLSDYTQTSLILTGPDSMAGIREGGYEYVLSPQEASE